ncbi:hypothetical protein GWI33_007420, partial [Rhynchophorus ferrugineus]
QTNSGVELEGWINNNVVGEHWVLHKDDGVEEDRLVV